MQVWRWIDEAWVVEVVDIGARHVVRGTAPDDSIHLMYARFDDTVFYATDQSGAWVVEPVPGAFRPLALSMDTGEPIASCMLAVQAEPLPIPRRVLRGEIHAGPARSREVCRRVGRAAGRPGLAESTV